MTSKFGSSRLHPTAATLFGMAIECWCKGLLLLAEPSSKPKDLYRFGHKLRDLAAAAGGVPDLMDTDTLELFGEPDSWDGTVPATKGCGEHHPYVS